MRARTIVQALTLATAFLSAGGFDDGARAAAPRAISSARRADVVAASAGILENRGQIGGAAAYYAERRGQSFYFAEGGVVVAVNGRDADGPRRWSVRADFVGANAAAPRGRAPTGTTYNWFRGPRSEWKTGVRAFREVVYADLWPGVDLVYEAVPSGLKYSFHVRPGGDPARIRLAWRGATSVAVEADGRLAVATPVGSFHDAAPVSFQERDGRRVAVATRLVAAPRDDGAVEVSFAVGPHDATCELVVDPYLTAYSGFLGGAGRDVANGVAVDSSSNAYVAGTSNDERRGMPQTVGGDLTSASDTPDAFVAKVSPAGTLVWVDYVGGDGTDIGNCVAVDSLGRAYVGGYATSPNAFPVVSGSLQTAFGGGQADGFLARIAADGASLEYSTFLGASGTDGVRGVAVGADFKAYVTGFGDGLPEPAGGPVEGSFGAFVSAIAADGRSVQYVRYFDGNLAGAGNGIAVDASGAAYVVGETASTSASFHLATGPDLVENGGVDGFVAKVTPTGALAYCGYIGGDGYDDAAAVAVDATGAAYVAGQSSSTQGSFPALGGGDLTYDGAPTAYYAKVAPSGASLEYCCYFGEGSAATGVVLGQYTPPTFVGRVNYVSPATFPGGVGGFPASSAAGQADAFVLQVGPDGAPTAGGFFGGTGTDDAAAVGVGPVGTIVVAGTTQSDEASFPVVAGPRLTSMTASPYYWADAYVMRFTIAPPTAPVLTSVSAASSSRIDVHWTDTSSEESGFEVERSDDGQSFALIASPAADVESHADATLLPDRHVFYRVRAVGLGGPSPWSGVAASTSELTFALTAKKKGGKLVNSAKPGKDSFAVAGAATPNAFAPAPPFDPALDPVTIRFGGAAAPETFAVPAGDPGWRKWGKTGRIWRSPKKTKPVRTLAIDVVKKRFSFVQTKFDFAAAPTNPITFVFHTDRDGATTTATWTPNAAATVFKSP